MTLLEELQAEQLRLMHEQTAARKAYQTATPAEQKRMRDELPNYTEELNIVEARIQTEMERFENEF
ncbi:MAG: hypothetical protein WCC22_20830 [Terriglobales bacterium]